MIFNSLSQKLPPIRHDIDLIPIQHEGNKRIYFYDSMGYIPENFTLDANLEPLLSFFDNHLSIHELSSKEYFTADTAEFLLFVQFLDEHNILHSSRFKLFRESTETFFEESEERNAWLAGKSYPDNPEKFASFLDNLFKNVHPQNPGNQNIPKALYAPHIDLSIGAECYAQAFSLLKHIRPERVVILGTSHYAGLYHPLYEHFPFIGSLKNYQLPGTVFKTDKDFMNQLANSAKPNGFTLQDRAHRIEHSIETHLVFLRHIWQHNFSIVPILVAGFDEILYHQNGALMEKIENFAGQLSQADNDDTFYLISGDLSHVGKKFGDSKPASEIKTSVSEFDQKFLLQAADANGLLRLVAEDFDKTRICGFPPLYAFLMAFRSLQAEKINYHWWDETEHESAVSFGSVLFCER